MEPAVPETPINDLTESIIGCAFRVGSILGHGFLEKVYENALAHELRMAGHHVQQQARIRVLYRGVEVGEYVADTLVDTRVPVEIKAAKALDDANMAQTLNCLKATGLRVALLLNFARRVEVKRVIFDPAP